MEGSQVEKAQYYIKKQYKNMLTAENAQCDLISLRPQFWFKTDTVHHSQNPTPPNGSHVSVLEEQRVLSCSGLCNIQPSCEFSLIRLMKCRVLCQPSRLLPLINLIRLRGRTPWLTSGLHALTPHSLVWQLTEPKHSAIQEADHSVTLVAANFLCLCAVLQDTERVCRTVVLETSEPGFDKWSRVNTVMEEILTCIKSYFRLI